MTYMVYLMRQNSTRSSTSVPGDPSPPSDPVQTALGPLVAAFVYKNDVVTVRRQETAQGPPEGRRDRPIRDFSRRSRRRLAFVACNTTATFDSMLTLTYPAEYPTDGQTVKGHLNTFLTWMRRTYEGLAYLWFFEFQKRGAPHIHLLVNVRLPGCLDRRAAQRRVVARRWYEICRTDDPKHLVAGTSWENERVPNGMVHYATKYATKMRQKKVPEGFQTCGRFWGRSRNVQTPVRHMVAISEEELRSRLIDWEYLPGLTTPLYKFLWNAAHYYCEAGDEVQDGDLPEALDPDRWGEVDSYPES